MIASDKSFVTKRTCAFIREEEQNFELLGILVTKSRAITAKSTFGLSQIACFHQNLHKSVSLVCLYFLSSHQHRLPEEKLEAFIEKNTYEYLYTTNQVSIFEQKPGFDLVFSCRFLHFIVRRISKNPN